MEFVNGWKYLTKDWNRVELKLRLSVLTVYEVYVDLSDLEYRFTLLNFTVTNKD